MGLLKPPPPPPVAEGAAMAAVLLFLAVETRDEIDEPRLAARKLRPTPARERADALDSRGAAAVASSSCKKRALLVFLTRLLFFGFLFQRRWRRRSVQFVSWIGGGAERSAIT